MKDRASNPNSPDYASYGPEVGRGVCDAWLHFENFYVDMFPSYEDGLTIERIDNLRGYSTANCRWATPFEQQGNKITNRVIVFRGERMHLAAYCRAVGASRGALSPRLGAGMTGDQAAADYAKSRYKRNRKSRSPQFTTS